MFARILLLLAPVVSLGCGINNNCGPLNPFGCAKDSGANMFGEDGSSAGETSGSSTTSGSTVTPTSGETSSPETSSDTTTPVDPTTSEATATSMDVSTTIMESTSTTDSMDTTSSTGDASTSESTRPMPECGNGDLEGTEECDDGNLNPKDSCDDKCLIAKRKVFVTSVGYTGNLGGLDGADDICQMHADADGVKLGGSFRAWLSTDEASPATQFADSDFTGKYVRVDGVVVAEGWQELTSGVLMNPINKDEMNALANGKAVWTNTEIDGTALSDEDCANWGVGGISAVTGLSSVTDSKWTNSESPQLCSSFRRLYCIEVP